jgi:hypothetical protein
MKTNTKKKWNNALNLVLSIRCDFSNNETV